jgi:two-component system CheB/CheR fusion protein
VSALEAESLESRFLILAPVGRDAALIQEALSSAGIGSDVCKDVDSVCSAAQQAAGVMLAEEAVSPNGLARLAQLVEHQPAWSDLPILLLSGPGAHSPTAHRALHALGNVTLLERPIRVAALVSAARSARRARERQYQMRSYMQERERITEALRQSERLYRAIGESIDYGVWVCDAEGRNIYSSESFLRLVGLTQKQCSDAGWVSVLHPDQRERTLEAWMKCVREGSTWDVEQEVLGVDGQYHPLLARGVAVKDEHGNPLCWAGINLDIRRLKQAEASLREADRRKDEFLATLAHELRNPLAPIKNALELLRANAASDATSQWSLGVIDRQVRHLGRLVDDLLDVSRITQGKIALRRERVALADVVRAAVETSEHSIQAGEQKLSVSLPPESVTLDADPVRLSQALSNLLNNASKYTPKHGHIALRAQRTADGGLLIALKDDGIGISSQMLPSVFEMFVQSESSRGYAQGGLGIGLTLVRTFVQMHGGTVEARSDGLGKGSEFVVHLPHAMVVDRAPALLPDISEKDIATAPRRVLVVEDSADGAESLRLMLSAAGHDVRVAQDGIEAVETADRFKPEIILMDMGLPRMDGYEAAARIRERGWAKEVRVIAITGWGEEDVRRRALAAGCDQHLVKPVEPTVLLSLIGTPATMAAAGSS